MDTQYKLKNSPCLSNKMPPFPAAFINSQSLRYFSSLPNQLPVFYMSPLFDKIIRTFPHACYGLGFHSIAEPG